MTDKEVRKEFMIRLNTIPVRVSYPKVHRAEAFRGSGRGASEDSGSKRFSCVFMIPKESEAFNAYHDMILDTIEDALDDAFNGKPPKIKADKWCYRDGDDEEKEEYKGHWILSTSAKVDKRPTVKDADGKTPLVEEDGKPYGGCYCFGWARIWIQDNEYGKRVNCELKAVQFVKDGEAFGGGGSTIDEEEFRDVRDTSERGGSRDRDRGDREDGDRDRRGSDRGSRDRDGDRRSTPDSQSRDRGSDRDDGRSDRRSREDDARSSRSRDRDRDDDGDTYGDRSYRSRDEADRPRRRV